MFKKIVGIALVCALGLSFAGCSDPSSGNKTAEETTTVVETTKKTTKATTKKVTKATTKKTEPPTEKRNVLDDAVRDLNKNFDDIKVSKQGESEIYIFELQDGMNSLLQRCRTDGNFSMDSYEWWLDYKNNIKGITDVYSDKYPGITFTWYILDDKKMSDYPTEGEQFSYIAEFKNGYCTFDMSDT